MSPLLIDTNIAIHLRDRDHWVLDRVAAIDNPLAVSMMSLVELEAGIFRNPDLRDIRRSGLESLIGNWIVLDLDRDVVRAYGQIVVAVGFSRAKVIDRLIAATAIANDLTLATINADDFRDIPGLTLDVWAPPAQ